jgi:F0F1-type ATP synthase assembly protein I
MNAYFWTMIGFFVLAEFADRPWLAFIFAVLAAIAGMGIAFISDLRKIAKEHAAQFQSQDKSTVTNTKEQ